ncbi:hypothetical protein C2845_PM01G08310 [Panicum miliaceum]|uniref:Uncharacterized protein n=1 Tax=Panicum miliaceum TaxID=4540 RepID=A0A3L6THH3_PANMI|nr:hypothetical protein C2845_PM01G08310 [Panicum miliaceum]
MTRDILMGIRKKRLWKGINQGTKRWNKQIASAYLHITRINHIGEGMNEASHRKTLGKEIGKLYQLIDEKKQIRDESEIFCRVTWTLSRGNPSWRTATSRNRQLASTFEEMLAI